LLFRISCCSVFNLILHSRYIKMALSTLIPLQTQYCSHHCYGRDKPQIYPRAIQSTFHDFDFS
jgi:hypothetical protein